MVLKAKVKAGVLLYALVMSMIFVLLLHYYVARIAATKRQEQAQIEAGKAMVMAHLTVADATNKEGDYYFEGGCSHYRQLGDGMSVTIVMDGGNTYTYQLPR